MKLVLTSKRNAEVPLFFIIPKTDSRGGVTCALNALAQHCAQYQHRCQLDYFVVLQTVIDGSYDTVVVAGDIHV